MPTIYFAAGSKVFSVKGENERWSLSEMNVGKESVRAVAADPSSGVVYAGTFDDGLFRTKDEGRTFEPIGEDKLQPRVMSLHVSPIQDERGLKRLYAGTEPSALYYSDDGGETWKDLPVLLELPSRSEWSFPPRPHTHHVNDITSGRQDGDFILAGIELGGVMRSLDGGETFEDRKPGSQFDVHNIKLHPDDDSRIYEAGGGGYAWSSDKGRTWITDNEGLGDFTYLVYIAADPADPDVVVASGARGPRHAYMPERAETRLFRKVSNEPWQQVTDGLPEEEGATVMHLLTIPEEPGVFYGVNNRGVYKSDNQGESWKQLNVALPSEVTESRITDACIVSGMRV